jgi:hypothetical protein
MSYKVCLNSGSETTIRSLADQNGFTFSTGCAGYELVKTEKVSAKKTMVLWKNERSYIDDISEIRRMCKLGNGDVSIRPDCIPTGYRLFVQSTSPNRKVPNGAAVLYFITKTDKASAAPVDAASEEPVDAAESQEDISARITFMKNTIGFFHHGVKGDYVVRAISDLDCTEGRERGAWPYAYVGNEWQRVDAAAWSTVSGALRLVCLWTYSPGGDETSQYIDAEYSEDIIQISGMIECGNLILPDGLSQEVFEVSSGDEILPSFKPRCPALELAQLNNMICLAGGMLFAKVTAPSKTKITHAVKAVSAPAAAAAAADAVTAPPAATPALTIEDAIAAAQEAQQAYSKAATAAQRVAAIFALLAEAGEEFSASLKRRKMT